MRMPHTNNPNKTAQMSSGSGGAGSACKGRGMENLKKRKLTDDTNNVGADISQDPGNAVCLKQASKTGQDASSFSDALAKHKAANTTIINDKADAKSRTNPTKSKKSIKEFRETKNKQDIPKMLKISKNKSVSPARENSEYKLCPKSKPSSPKEQANALSQGCHNLKKVEAAPHGVVNLPAGSETGTALKARIRKPISRFTDTTMRYKRSYLSSMPVTKKKASVILCSSEKTKKASKKTGEEDSGQNATTKTSGNQKAVNKNQTTTEFQVEKRKAPTEDERGSSTNKAKKSKMSLSAELQGKCPNKFVQRTVKRPKLKQSPSKNFGFWRGSRLRRMASLNAQAKVHILYENDARSSSPEERCDEDGGNQLDRKVLPLDVPALDKRSSLVSAGGKQTKHGPVKPDEKKVTEKQPINRLKNAKVATKKHKANKKPKVEDVPVMMVMPKRMASLNAQAILAASYSSERYRLKPLKSPSMIKTPEAAQSTVPDNIADVAPATIMASSDTVRQIIDAVASGKLKFYRRIMKASLFKNKIGILKNKPDKGTKVPSQSPKGNDAASGQKRSTKVAKWRKDITGKLGVESNKRRKLLADVVVVASDDAVIIESPKVCEITTDDASEKPKERKEGFYQDECDPEKDDMDKSLDIAKVVITTTELQPATNVGADKISVKAEAIRRDKIEDTAEVTITGMYINPVTNTSQSFCISRIHTYKQASSTLSYSPQAMGGGPTGVHVGGIVGPQQPVVGGPTTASSTVISPQPQAPPQPQASTIPPHHVTGTGSLHPGHLNPPTAHLHGGTATLCPYSSAAAAQPCSIGGMPLVDVALSRHYGSAFTVPHYGHHYAHGYYPSSGPLMQTMATDPCLIHKPVPFHPHSFQAEHCQSHPPSGATQSMQPFPTADQCHAHPPTPYPPPGPGPGGPQQPQPTQQHYVQGVDTAPPNSSPLASVGGQQCGMPPQPSLDKCTPQPPKPSNVPNATASCFNDASCQSCAAAAAAAAVAVAVATEQYSTAAQHYSLVSTKPSVPPSASAPPPPSSPAVSATPRQFSARSRTRMPSTIMDTASTNDPYGRLPPTKPDVGRQNALPIQTQTDHAQDVPAPFAPKTVKVETVDSCSDGSESERQREKEPGTPKDFGYTPPAGHHHMETRRLKWRGYTPSGTPPLQDMVIKSNGHGMGREEKGGNIVAIRNLRNKRQNLAAMAASRKNGNAYTKRQLRHKDVAAVAALSPEESFKKSVVSSWLRSPKQQQHRRKVEALRKTLLAEDTLPLVTTAMTNSFSTRRRKLDDSQPLIVNGKPNSAKGILGDTNKELVIRTRRLDIASLKECNGKLRMRDVTNERLHSEYSRGRSYRPLNHQSSHASSHSSSSSSSTIQALPPHKGCNGQHPNHHPVTTRRNSSSSAASTTSSGLSSSKSTSHYANDKVPRPFLRSKGGKKLPRYSNGWTWDGQPFQQAVYIHNDDPPITRKCFPAMRHIQGDIIKVRDCVLLKSGPRKSDLPYVAKVTALWENSDDGEMMFSLLWYYRPEHTEQGRKCHHMEDEIFASKHQDMNSVACIEDKCYVLTTNEYCRYRCRSRMLEEGLRPKPSVVPDLDEGYPRKDRQPPGRISPEMIFVCRKVYEFRQKRILKNPT